MLARTILLCAHLVWISVLGNPTVDIDACRKRSGLNANAQRAPHIIVIIADDLGWYRKNHFSYPFIPQFCLSSANCYSFRLLDTFEKGLGWIP